MIVKRLGQGAELVRERRSGEILESVVKGVGAGKNRSMRGQGERHLGDGQRKKDAFPGQSINRGGLDLLVAVAAEMVGAQRINSDEKNVVAQRSAARGRMLEISPGALV